MKLVKLDKTLLCCMCGPHLRTILCRPFQVPKINFFKVAMSWYCAPVAQLVEHRAVMQEVVSLTLAGPTLRVLK